MEGHCSGKFLRVSGIEYCTRRTCRIKTTIRSYVVAVVISCLYLAMPCSSDSPQQLELSYTLVEERDPASTIVARLLDEQSIVDVIGSMPVESVHFQFVSDLPAFFDLDTNTGLLTIMEPVDRDIQCPNEDKCQIHFSLTLEPVTPVTLVSVVIHIHDINDHAPQFTETHITKSLPESTLPGYAFVLPKVTDPDSPDFSVQSYELSTTTTEPFQLRATTKPDGSSDVRLVLSGDLDRETDAEYQLKVIAVDGGNPPMSGTLDITIIVTDTNDNNPTFDQGSYEVSIPENVMAGYFVAGVHASDVDTGLNSQIIYRFSTDTFGSLGGVFSINNSTGEITVIGNVDYEESAILYLTVEARDLGADPVPTEVVVIVHIEDVNDHSPEILVHTLGGPGVQEATVLEGAATGTFVARVVVSDDDSGDNGRYNCSLNEELFVLDPLGTDFLITTHGDLDRDKKDQYSLAITCRDFGRQPLTTITYIQVKLQDINDNSPQFSEGSYFWQITENNLPHAVLLQVNATDDDEGENAEVEYSIQGAESHKFEVEPMTGLVRASISLDRELESRHNVLLVATDKGDSTRSGTTTLVVDVLDVNDEVPRFTLDMYPFSVPENEEADLEVGFVQAEDSDSAEFNKHTFSLQDSSAPFDITPDTGRLSTNMVLDREQQRVYTLVVVATDTSEPYFSSSATVSVYVMDRNDNPPRFTFPTSDNNTVHISNQAALGQIVTRVTAEDLDIDKNGRVAYEIVHASQDGVFTIDRNMGAIAVGVDVANMDNVSFSLSIVASDNGPSPMSTSVTLHIVISKTLDGGSDDEAVDVGPNVIILVSVACISGILIVSLILAIVIMLRKQRHMHHKNHHDNRMEALKIMANGEAQAVKVAHRPEFSNLNSEAPVRDPQPDLMMEIQGSRDMKNLSPPPFSTAAQNHYTTTSKSNKVDLSLEKSRQWLETLQQHPQSDPGLLSPSIAGLSPARDTPSQPYPPIPARAPVLGVQPLKSCLKNPLPGSTRKESGDSDSVNSAAVSNTDSGHGASELEDVLPPRGVTYSPAGNLPSDKTPQYRGYHGNQLRDQLQKPAVADIHAMTSSTRHHQLNPTQRHLSPQQTSLPDYLQTRDSYTTRREPTQSPLKSFGKSAAAHGEQYSQHGRPSPADSFQNPTGNNTTDIETTPSHMYSLGDMSDVINSSKDNRYTPSRHNHTHDDDDASSMSGSYVVDASALVREIDDIFFKDVVV